LRGTKGTAAGVYRVFEIVVRPATSASPFTMTAMQTAIQDLATNYGQAGLAYARFLGEHGDVVKAQVKLKQLDFEQRYAFKAEERYWLSSMTTLIVGATIANGLGLTDFDLVAMERLLAETLKQMRQRVSRDVEQMQDELDADELLGELMSDLLNRHMLVTQTISVASGRPAENKVLTEDQGMRLTGVWAQLGIDDGILRVKQTQFKNWLDEHSYNIVQVLDLLRRHKGLTEGNRVLGAGTRIGEQVLSRSPARCYDIEVPDSLIHNPSSPSANPGCP